MESRFTFTYCSKWNHGDGQGLIKTDGLGSHDHTASVLPFEMYGLEPGETPSLTLTWKPLGFLNHMKRRTNGDRFPLSLWDYDSFGDHLQTCPVKSSDSQVHDWVVYRLGDILGSVGHRVKIHKITRLRSKNGVI